MVQEVKKEEAKRYLKKAESFYTAALDEFGKSRYDVVIFDASQAIILANDALCIALLGERPSKDHREAVQLHIQASAGKENKREIISNALEMRSEYGYTEKSAKEQDARSMLIRAKRFFDWVKERIGYEE